jgi:hypothetical protein
VPLIGCFVNYAVACPKSTKTWPSPKTTSSLHTTTFIYNT